MKWLEIIINVKKEYVEEASEIFYSIGVNGIQIDEPMKIEQEGNLYWDYLEEQSNEERESKVSAYFSTLEDFGTKLALIQRAVQNLKLQNEDAGSGKIEIKEHEQEQWESSWKQYFKPIKITDRIVVKPGWEEYEANEGEIVVNIDPGMAFGTGSHETTSMCIKAIEENSTPYSTLLDIGTGSGILSIVAVLLGLESAVGIDLDPVAVQVAKENIELNNVADKIEVLQGDLISSVSGKYDIVVANIIADAILILLDSDVKQFMKDDGKLICSGIILEKESIVVDKLLEKGFNIIKIDRQGEWVCITSDVNNG